MLLDIQNVTLGYEGTPVVAGLNFSLSRGDYLCILGQNGSGKTTLMKAMLGFLDPMEGKSVRHFPKNAVGYLPQQHPSQADFPASVKEVVLSGCQSNRRFSLFYSREDRELAQKNMDLTFQNLQKTQERLFSGPISAISEL